MLNELHKEDNFIKEGIHDLFKSLDTLKNMLKRSVTRAAIFLLVRDYSVFSDAENISPTLQEKIFKHICKKRYKDLKSNNLIQLVHKIYENVSNLDSSQRDSWFDSTFDQIGAYSVHL